MVFVSMNGCLAFVNDLEMYEKEETENMYIYSLSIHAEIKKFDKIGTRKRVN